MRRYNIPRISFVNKMDRFVFRILTPTLHSTPFQTWRESLARHKPAPFKITDCCSGRSDTHWGGIQL